MSVFSRWIQTPWTNLMTSSSWESRSGNWMNIWTVKCRYYTLQYTHIVPDFVCKQEIFACLCLSRSWPERNRAGQRRWSLWRTIASSWRRRWIMAMTRLCNNWRQHSNSEWRPLTTLVLVIPAAAGWFDSCGHALLRHHLVLQETNEERRTVASNLTSVFTTATNHVSTSEVNLS